MGQRILDLAIEDSETFNVVAGVDQRSGTLRELGLASDAPLGPDLPDHPGAVVIDFSHASCAESLIERCADAGLGLVMGTTGIAPVDLDRWLAAAAERVPVLWAPNMSIGVNLVFQEAARIAAALGLDYDIEIVEAHHHHKVDAPSGTALGIADAIAEATDRTRADYVHGREGHTGARRRGEIGMHALRMGDVVGDHEVWFVGGGERIRLGHQAHSRDIFARGALRAADWLAGREPGRYAMADVLGLG